MTLWLQFLNSNLNKKTDLYPAASGNCELHLRSLLSCKRINPTEKIIELSRWFHANVSQIFGKSAKENVNRCVFFPFPLTTSMLKSLKWSNGMMQPYIAENPSLLQNFTISKISLTWSSSPFGLFLALAVRDRANSLPCMFFLSRHRFHLCCGTNMADIQNIELLRQRLFLNSRSRPLCFGLFFRSSANVSVNHSSVRETFSFEGINILVL